MPVVSNEKCESVFRYNWKSFPYHWKITENHVCAGFNDGNSPHTCHGDSGGPLICNVAGIATLVGITSFGSIEDCGKMQLYTVFGRVSKVKSWIKKHM